MLDNLLKQKLETANPGQRKALEKVLEEREKRKPEPDPPKVSRKPTVEGLIDKIINANSFASLKAELKDELEDI